MIANPKIFKAYDVRGVWDKDWDEEFVYNIGKGIATCLKPKVVAIGFDMRTSSEAVFSQLSKSLGEEGVVVKNLGLCSTELSYFAVNFVDEVDVAIMITASHNPGEYNGIKLTLKSGSIGLDSGLDKIRDASLTYSGDSSSFVEPVIEPLDLWTAYKKHVFALADIDLSLLEGKKIVVDPGNGMGGYMFDKILGDDLPLEIIKLNWTPDGNFPAHEADPFVEKNVEPVMQKVKEHNADLGLSYDGDSDRVFFVDEMGRYVPGYYTAAVLTDFLLSGSSEEVIVHDPRYYKATVDVIKSHNGTPVKSRVGHTLIKQKMKENNSLFSAECSGHIFFRSNKFAESSMLATLYMLKFICNNKLSSRTNDLFEKYPISGEINFIVDDTSVILSKIEQNYSAGEVDKLDGLSISFSDWRFNLRSSNTQPLLRLNVEADSKLLVNEKVLELKDLIGGKLANH